MSDTDKILAVVETARNLRWYVEGVEMQAEFTGRRDFGMDTDVVSDLCDAVIEMDSYPMMPRDHVHPGNRVVPRAPVEALLAALTAAHDRGETFDMQVSVCAVAVQRHLDGSPDE